jgi:UvrD/REP helicase N-terminal domain
MGFASCLENNSERNYDRWQSSGGTASCFVGTEEERLIVDPLERPRRVIEEFWRYYREPRQLLNHALSNWEKHFDNVALLNSILAPIAQLTARHADAWQILVKVKKKLLALFKNVHIYGPPSPSAIEKIQNVSREIHSRCNVVIKELNDFPKKVRERPLKERESAKLREAIQRLDEIHRRLDRDFAELSRHEVIVKQNRQLWDRFIELFTSLAIAKRFRPKIGDLDRFVLSREQEKLVAFDRDGVFRIQGASGSGKTIIMIHRALRLAQKNRGAARQVRVFTINRTLADLLRAAVEKINGSVPPNLHVAAVYDFMLGCVSLFEPRTKYRLADPKWKERIAFSSSWQDFYNHKRNIFSDDEVKGLVRSIESREGSRLDANRYLRDEMIYIQSAYSHRDRQKYLSENRQSRSIVFQRAQKEVCLQILHAWEDWLDVGHLCDIDGLTQKTAKHFEEASDIARIQKAFPTDFLLIDEAQDFSTLELTILRKLVRDIDGENAMFLVGDLNQKVYPKHHNTRSAGFDFRNRTRILKKSFRNTRQILQAARNLPKSYPPREDEERTEVIDPELSIYDGPPPVLLRCTRQSQLRQVMWIVQHRRGIRTAVVSENELLLDEIRHEARTIGLRCQQLVRNEDLDRWEAKGDSRGTNLVVSRLEAVKGFEFDTVIACDLSLDTIPHPGTPQEEWWRQAAVLYAALTRARDELFMTYVGKPSRFLYSMAHDLVHIKSEAIGSQQMEQLLALTYNARRCQRVVVAPCRDSRKSAVP